LAYQQQPTPEESVRLEAEFDRLFSTCTGFAWDTFMSLAATSKKQSVSFYQYIHDRISKANQIPSLASLIETRASELELGASWSDA